MHEAYLVLFILAGTLGLFISGVWRYDIVALFALVISILIGIVPYSNAFSGFSNPAVVTVACVMVITYAITQTGIVDYAVKKLTPTAHSTTTHIAALTFTAAILSAFMNNVGALALMMPITLQSAHEHKLPPSLLLLPLAFGSILGGLTTAIGTPPNILISAYREQITGHQFAMFDFAPVGITLAFIGTIYLAVLGWRLIPERKAKVAADELYQIHDYVTEIMVPEESNFVNKTVRELESLIEADYVILGLIRKRVKRLAIAPDEVLQAKDILIVEAGHNDLEKLLHAAKLELVGGEKISSELLRSDDIAIMEAVVVPGSRIEGRSAQAMRLRSRHHLHLLAIARQGRPFKKRLNHVNLRAGDVVLLQGDAESLQETILSLGFLPLEERGVQVGMPRRAYLPVAIFVLAIVLVTLQVMPVQIAFTAAVVAMVIFNVIPVRKIYESIDWPVIILLGAIIPIGSALQTTGGTELIAHMFIQIAANTSPVFILGLLLILTMTLSDVMNNAATAVVMAPIAVSIAQALKVDVDPFLMTVAIGASCSFLTPIGHQNNTLVMGPGGYKFQDYFRIGLPLELIVLAVGLPMILWVWPLK